MNWQDISELASKIEALEKEIEPLLEFYKEYTEKHAQLMDLKARFSESVRGYTLSPGAASPDSGYYRRGQKSEIATNAILEVGSKRSSFSLASVEAHIKAMGHDMSRGPVIAALERLETDRIVSRLSGGLWTLHKE